MFFKIFSGRTNSDIPIALEGQNIHHRDGWARYFGQASKGIFQLRGNGTFILTDQVLYFRMWLFQRELIIPLNEIVSVETTGSFLGKADFFRPLLKIIFRREGGQEDSAAWGVTNLEKIINVIQESIK